MTQGIRLTDSQTKVIALILQTGNTAEIAVRNGKVIIWEVKSKKKSEQPIA